MKVGIGIVGLGFGRYVHLPAFLALPGARLVGVVSATPEIAESVSDHHCLPRRFSNWKDLVACPDIQAVSVATPPALHAEVVLASIRAGKSVLCEKPLAACAREARSMLRVARLSGVVHMVGFEFREIPAWRLAKEILDSGEIGEIRGIGVSWSIHSWSDPTRPWSWRSDRKACGGVLSGWGVHCFDYLEWLAGPVRAMSARLSTQILQRPDSQGKLRRVTAADTASILMELTCGASAQLSVISAAGSGRGHWIEIYGAKRTLVVGSGNLTDYGRGYQVTLSEKESTRPRRVPIPTRMRLSDKFQDGRIAPFHRLASRFVRAVAQGKAAVEPSFAAGYRAQLLMDLAMRADRERCWVSVPKSE